MQNITLFLALHLITSPIMTHEQPAVFTWKDILTTIRNGNPAPPRTVVKSDAEWRAILTEEEFYVTRKHGTERPGTGEYCGVFTPGIYACRCCGTNLFDSSEKFESGTGWPSFTQPLAPNVIKYILDRSYSMERVETRCNVCDAHLGHVFPDGPKPSGLRYCINSAALKKVEGKTASSK
jgi:peptide-methionine (R)-S-oxide reductase